MDWAIITVVYATLFIASPLIVILHELGHAFAYLILTKPAKIDIYIGAYTKPAKALQFKAGKLNFYIKRSFPFIKGIGLCKSHTLETNYVNNIIILLAGSFFTFFVAAIPAIIIIYADVHILVIISCCIFLGLSALSLIGNLVPRPVDIRQQVSLDSDGKQILFTLKVKQSLAAFIEAWNDFENKEFELAIDKLKNVLSVSPAEPRVLRLLIITLINAKKYDDAAAQMELLESRTELTINDLFNKSYLLSVKKMRHEAILSYSKVLKKDRQHVLALNNMGFELIKQNAHDVARQALETAIKLKPEFDHPYSNLGYSKILLGEFDEGKRLIDKSLSLNPANACAYEYLGLYYLRVNEFAQANAHFHKAVELDASIDLSVYAEEMNRLKLSVTMTKN